MRCSHTDWWVLLVWTIWQIILESNGDLGIPRQYTSLALRSYLKTLRVSHPRKRPTLLLSFTQDSTIYFRSSLTLYTVYFYSPYFFSSQKGLSSFSLLDLLHNPLFFLSTWELPTPSYTPEVNPHPRSGVAERPKRIPSLQFLSLVDTRDPLLTPIPPSTQLLLRVVCRHPPFFPVTHEEVDLKRKKKPPKTHV